MFLPQFVKDGVNIPGNIIRREHCLQGNMFQLSPFNRFKELMGRRPVKAAENNCFLCNRFRSFREYLALLPCFPVRGRGFRQLPLP